MINLLSNIKIFLKNEFFRLKNRKIIDQTIKIKSMKKDKNVILLATGKSLSKIDLKKINNLKSKNYEIFSLGGFLATDVSQNVDIDYYLLSDERTIFPDKFDLEKKQNDINIKTIEVIKKKKIKLFLPTETWGKHNFKDNEIFYFNNNPDNKTKNITDITKYFGYGSISGLKSLSVCRYLGYKKIYFIGLDNNHWNNIKVNHENEIFQVHRHFYDDDGVYRKNFNVKSISNLLRRSSGVFEGFEKFKKFDIINLDPDSLIDCFSKTHQLDVYK